MEIKIMILDQKTQYHKDFSSLQVNLVLVSEKTGQIPEIQNSNPRDDSIIYIIFAYSKGNSSNQGEKMYSLVSSVGISGKKDEN